MEVGYLGVDRAKGSADANNVVAATDEGRADVEKEDDLVL